jgi:predicted nucleic acid-binding protein
VLIDAGPLYAALDRDDAHHAECRELLESAPGPLLVPLLVVSEVVYFLATRLGAEAEVRFLGDLAAGVLLAEPVAAEDWVRIAELVWTYRDMRLGTIDASILAAAERLGESVIATLDRRHFGAVRPRHAEALQLVP